MSLKPGAMLQLKTVTDKMGNTILLHATLCGDITDEDCEEICAALISPAFIIEQKGIIFF